MRDLFRKVCTGLLLVASTVPLSAQPKWTLRDCIAYARQENIQVRKAKITAATADVEIKQAQAALFPSLSGNISQGYNHAKDAANDYKYRGLLSGQYGVNASWTLFNGKQNLHAVKQARLQKESDAFNVQEQQNQTEIAITQVYVQLLYARESIKNNENLVESSALQLKQTRDFLDAGSITRAEYAQVESQYSTDKYNLVVARNAYETYLLQLKQLLELGVTDTFEPDFSGVKEDVPETPVPSKHEVYQTALQLMPGIRSNRLGIDIAQLGKSTAKAGYLPTVSVNGSVGSNHAWDRDYPAFSTQINRNFNQYVGLSVNIPIAANRKNKSNVERADLQIQIAELNYIQAEKELWSTIESLHLDAVSGQSKYQAAKDKAASSEWSYTLVKEQYALGMRNTVELTTEQNKYANALQELSQAKYTALLSLTLLDFYRGKEIAW